MVGDETHVRVVGESVFVEPFQKDINLLVDVGDLAVVAGASAVQRGRVDGVNMRGGIVWFGVRGEDIAPVPDRRGGIGWSRYCSNAQEGGS